MKIKTICEITGLTDRTIRYYIEKELVCPAYTENYLGRKSFHFSQEDIEILKSISVLRQFDFTIDEIQQIIIDANSSSTIIANVINRITESVSLGEEKLVALSKLSTDKGYTLEQLAEELSKPSISLPEHNERDKSNSAKTIISLIKSILIFVIVWSPIALGLFAVIMRIRSFHYPVFNYLAILLTVASFFPSISVLFVSKTTWKWKKTAKGMLLILCICSIPISFVLSLNIVEKSETTDFRNYRCFDTDCPANANTFFQDLFPIWPRYFVDEKQPDGSLKTVYLDAHYYYCKGAAFDYTYDIYAEWPLEKKDFDIEVRRVQILYDNCATEYDRKYDIIRQGSYICLIAYNGHTPFKKVTDSYEYHIFAYDETNLTVRYITCVSLENGADQPYYLTLDW